MMTHLVRHFVARLFLPSLFFWTACLFPALIAAHQTGASTFIAHLKPATKQVDTLLALPTMDLGSHLELDTDENGVLSPQELREGEQQILDYLDGSIVVRNDGATCRTIEKKLSPLEESQVRMWYLEAFECSDDLGRVTLENVALTETIGGYRHLGKIQVGDRLFTTVFSREFPTYTLELSGGEPTEVDPSGAEAGAEAQVQVEEPPFLEFLLRYVWEGVLHILLGLDHVLFVVILVLISRKTRRLLYVVTAFTVAHSLTLAASALELLTISPAVVEPIIAVSIAYVAVEAMFRKTEPRYLYLATFFFGLVHGFGFSYVLRDEVGLPTESLLPALFSFNVGVELGQIAIVLVLFPLRRLAREKDWEMTAVRAVAAVVLAISVYWFFERIV